MNRDLLQGKLRTVGKNFSWLLEELKKRGTPISHSAFYRKLKGTSEFERHEISAISRTIGLSKEEMTDIFFDELVS